MLFFGVFPYVCGETPISTPQVLIILSGKTPWVVGYPRLGAVRLWAPQVGRQKKNPGDFFPVVKMQEMVDQCINMKIVDGICIYMF